MRITSEYVCDLAFFREDGSAIGRFPAGPVDWTPATEVARWLGIQAGVLGLYGEAVCTAEVRPVFNEDTGGPHVNAFEVIASDGNGQYAHQVPIAYLTSQAQAAAAERVGEGLLQAGETFRYGVGAYFTGGGEQPKDGAGGLQVAEVKDQALVARPARLSDLRARATAAGPDTAGLLPVCIEEAVLASLETTLARDLENEAGSFLLGHICRDPDGQGLFAYIQAQVPAEQGRASPARFTFTPDTFAHALHIIALRGDQECLLGWAHSHLPLGDGGGAFRGLSQQDLCLHRLCFPRAFQVALLLSRSAEGKNGRVFSLFGSTRDGQIAERGFERLTAATAPEANASHSSRERNVHVR